MILVLGFVSLFNKTKAYAITFVAIFFLAAVASTLWLYPLGGRFSLFMVPLVIILIGQSLDWLEHRLQTKRNLGMAIAALMGIYLLYAPAAESLNNFINPKYYEHIRPSMATLSENWMEGDVLFVSSGAVPAFRFYADRYGLGDVTYESSAVSDYLQPDNILAHIKSLDGKPRVWILITHVYENEDFNEKDFLLNYLDTIGNKKRDFRSASTSVYLFLYDLASK